MMSSPGSSLQTPLISHMFHLLCVLLGKINFLLFLSVLKVNVPLRPTSVKQFSDNELIVTVHQIVLMFIFNSWF